MYVKGQFIEPTCYLVRFIEPTCYLVNTFSLWILDVQLLFSPNPTISNIGNHNECCVIFYFYFYPLHLHPPSRNNPSKNSMGLA